MRKELTEEEQEDQVVRRKSLVKVSDEVDVEDVEVDEDDIVATLKKQTLGISGRRHKRTGSGELNHTYASAHSQLVNKSMDVTGKSFTSAHSSQEQDSSNGSSPAIE